MAGVGVACSPPLIASSIAIPPSLPPPTLDPDMEGAPPTLAREARDPRLESVCICTSGEVLIGLGPSECEYELAVVLGVVYAVEAEAGGGG